MSDDTPTERFVPPTPPDEAPPAASPGPANGGHRSKTLIIILSIIGGLLLIAVVVLLTLLFSAKNGVPGASASPTPQVTASQTPSESPSPSATPSESTQPSTAPSPSTPPTTTGQLFTSFEPTDSTSAGCTSDSGSASVTFTWTSTGATEAAIGVATTDAFAGPYEAGLPASGSFDLNYQCNLASQFYTVSIKGPSGQTNKTVTLTR